MAGHRRMYQFRHLLDHWMNNELDHGTVCETMAQTGTDMTGHDRSRKPAVEDVAPIRRQKVTVKNQFSQTIIVDNLPQNSQESILTESLIAERGSSTLDDVFTDDDVDSVRNDNYNSSKYCQGLGTSSDTDVPSFDDVGMQMSDNCDYPSGTLLDNNLNMVDVSVTPSKQVEFRPKANRGTRSLTSMPGTRFKRASAHRADAAQRQQQEKCNRSQNSQTTDAVPEKYSDIESDDSWPSVQWTDSSAEEFPSLRSRVGCRMKSAMASPSRKQSSRNLPPAFAECRSSSLIVPSHHSELVIPKFTADTRQAFGQLASSTQQSSMMQGSRDQTRTLNAYLADDIGSKRSTGSRSEMTKLQQRATTYDIITASSKGHQDSLSKRLSKIDSHHDPSGEALREQAPSKANSSHERRAAKGRPISEKHTIPAPTYDYDTSYQTHTSYDYESDSRQTLSTQETTNFDDIENEYVIDIRDGEHVHPKVSHLLHAPRLPPSLVRRSMPSYCYDGRGYHPPINIPVIHKSKDSKPRRSSVPTALAQTGRKLHQVAFMAYDNAFKILGVVCLLYFIFILRCMLCQWRHQTDEYRY